MTKKTEPKVLQTTIIEDELAINDLTDVELDGSGVFDKFLTLHRKVLDREFKQGRIIGKEYSDTFTKTYIANMEMAIQFTLAKEKQAYDISLIEAQTKQADKQSELTNKELELKQYILENHLPEETKKFKHENELLTIKVKTDQFILDKKLPQEIELARIQRESQEYLLEHQLPANKAMTEKQITKLDSDMRLTDKEIELRDYDLKYVKPQELKLATKQVEQMDALIQLNMAELEIKKFTLEKEFPLKLKYLEAQTLHLEAQMEIVREQLKVIKWEIKYKFPEEVKLIKANITARLAEVEIQKAKLKYLLKELELKLPAEIDLMKEQARKMRADTDIAYKQLELITIEIEKKLPIEIALLKSQAKKMEADAKLAEHRILIAYEELTLMKANIQAKYKELSILEEQLILARQKNKTERAQTEAGIAEEGSIIDMNIKTLEAQIEGMDRDAKNKVLQMLLATWTTRMDNDGAGPPVDAHLADSNIKQAVVDVLGTVGMTVQTTFAP